MRLISGAAVAAALVVAAHGAVRAQAGIVTVGVPGRANFAPSIAADGARVAVAWGARDAQGRTDVYAAISADGGTSFGPPVRVNARPGSARIGGEMPPRVAIRGDRVDVLWTARDDGTRIVTARSDDGGGRFGGERALQRPGAAGDRGWPALTVDPRGGLHAIWLDHRAAAGGHHAMPERSGLYYSDGTRETEIARGVCYCCKTAVAAGPRDRVFAAWRHVYPGNLRDIAFSLSVDGGRTFTPPARVSQDGWRLDGCPDDGPSMAVDASGAVHLAWPSVVEGAEPYKAIFYTSTRDGRSFLPRTRVTPAGRNAAHPQIVADALGVTILWDESVGGTRQAFALRRAGMDRAAAPIRLNAGTSPSLYPAAAVAGGRIVAAWVDGAGDASIIAVRRLDVAGR